MLLLVMAGLLGLAFGFIIGALVEEQLWQRFTRDLLNEAYRDNAPKPAERPRPPEQPADWPASADVAEFGPLEPEDKKEQRKKERLERTFWS